ncbi:low affinity immunoglobulin gamma Fc region receptor III-like [Carassius auratus]|uniref:low affinity immunoglobulin gamma Fc region receptor III-like n=1 Tax=Carassius auratus TaxID=7957 RepID=UPI000E404B1D|nr:low affinity immunoglobulin gamma Fc region receptor III-like [Carassius auratus]
MAWDVRRYGLPTAMEMAELMFNHVFRYFGIPEDIVLDRGPQFISRVWRVFHSLLGVAISLSSGYHLQSKKTFEPSDVPAADYWFRESERVWDAAHHQLQRALRGRRTTADLRRSEAPQYHPVLISNIRPGQTQDRPRVRVKPQSSVFNGDTVTLSCDVGQSTGRTIIWIKNSEIIETGDQTKTLRDVRVSDGGQYACTIAGGEITQSKPVLLTVRERPKPVLRVDPDEHVIRGQTVNLTCDIQETDVSIWSYIWNKDDSEIDVSQSQEYRISSVDESHTGRYSCTGRETGGSRSSHTSDTVTLTLSGLLAPSPVFSFLKLLSSLLAASPYLLVSIILGVKCYRAHVQSDESVEIKYTVTEE